VGVVTGGTTTGLEVTVAFGLGATTFFLTTGCEAVAFLTVAGAVLFFETCVVGAEVFTTFFAGAGVAEVGAGVVTFDGVADAWSKGTAESTGASAAAL